MNINERLKKRSSQPHLKSLKTWGTLENERLGQSKFRKILSGTLLSFCRETSLHGVRNVVDDIRQLSSTLYTKQQKLVNVISLTIWISACVIGAVFATTLTGLVWTRFLSTPTITTVETNNYPIWKVNFPAITICNNNRVYRPAAETIKQMLITYGVIPTFVDKFLRQLAKLVVAEYTEDLFIKTHALLLQLNYTTERLMFERWLLVKRVFVVWDWISVTATLTMRTAKKYTFQSCISECAVDTILAMCNCLPFYYAEVHLRKFSSQHRQCTLNDVNCLRENRHIFSSLQPEGLNETTGMSCPKCLPSCTEETYTFQTMVGSQSERNEHRNHFHPSHFGKVIEPCCVALKVHFKDMTCIKYRRDVFMTWDGFFAAFGGIFGLCMGGSVISVVEFFYYFTFKLWNSLRNGLRPKKNSVGRSMQEHRVQGSTLIFHRNGVNLMLAKKLAHTGATNGKSK